MLDAGRSTHTYKNQSTRRGRRAAHHTAEDEQGRGVAQRPGGGGQGEREGWTDRVSLAFIKCIYIDMTAPQTTPTTPINRLPDGRHHERVGEEEADAGAIPGGGARRDGGWMDARVCVWMNGARLITPNKQQLTDIARHPAQNIQQTEPGLRF